MPYTTALHIAQPPEAGQLHFQIKSQEKKKKEREQSYTECQVWANLLFRHSKIEVYCCYNNGVTPGMSQTIIIFVVENFSV